MNGELLNTFKKEVPGAKIDKVFDVGSELLIAIKAKTDPFYFVDKKTKKVRGARYPKDLPLIERTYTNDKGLTL